MLCLAVDNPEYFQMSSGDGAKTEEKDLNRNIEETKKPGSLEKNLTNLNENEGPEGIPILKEPNIVSQASRDLNGKKTSEIELSTGSCDEPPAVPPRSENSKKEVLDTVLQSRSFIGEYIYTKSDEESSEWNRDYSISSDSHTSGFNDVNSVHNLLYKSFPSCSEKSNSFSSCNKVNLDRSSTSAYDSPNSSCPSSIQLMKPLSRSKGQQYYNEIPCSNIKQNYENDISSALEIIAGSKCSEDALSHASSKKDQVIRERIQEQQEAAEEQFRLDEILNICAEYEKQQNYRNSYNSLPESNGNYGSKDSILQSSQHNKQHSTTISPLSFSQNRIKTNGSLPRDKRSSYSPSPVSPSSGSLSASPTSNLKESNEHSRYFKFDGSYDSTNSFLENVHSDKSGGHLSTSHPVKPTSPYENVLYPTKENGLPLSPRTRIRTTFPVEHKVTLDTETNFLSNKNLLSLDRIKSSQAKYDSHHIPHKTSNHSVGSATPEGSSSIERFSFTTQLESEFQRNLNLKSKQSNSQDLCSKLDNQNEFELLQTQRELIMETIRDIKSKIAELEIQENESLRELQMEKALIEGELQAAEKNCSDEELSMSELVFRSDQMELQHQRDRKNDQQAIHTCKVRLEKAEATLRKLETNTNCCVSNSEGKNSLNSIKAQNENVEAEKKIYEDTEFNHMESEVLRESEREEMNNEILEMSKIKSSVKEKVTELEGLSTEMANSLRLDSENFGKQRQNLQVQLKKARQQVMELDYQLGKHGPLDPELISASCSTDSGEYLQMTPRNLENRTSFPNPMMQTPSDKGLKCAMEVRSPSDFEWSKDSYVVCDESVASLASENSSMGSSELLTESLSSDEIVGQRQSREVDARFLRKMRQKSDCATDSLRPVSDASSFCGSELMSSVKLRAKTKKQQRPLTRYLPIRSEERFDLSLHLEAAGHQVHMCPSVTVESMTCKGYLHKLGSRIRTWQKRWFVFDRTKRALIYFKDKSEDKPRGGAYFQTIEEVYVDHLQKKSPGAQITFCVKTNARVFQLMASTPEAMRIWVDVIFTGAEAYNQFGV